MREDRTKVTELTRTLGEIVTIAADRWSKTEEQRAQEISAWVRYARPIAEKIGIVPIIPLDVEIKSSLINTACLVPDSFARDTAESGRGGKQSEPNGYFQYQI